MNKEQRKSQVYFCPTPIGNLEDITLRTLRILEEVDVILCEDTRHSIPLLNHYEIKKPLISYHKYNEQARVDEILKWLEQGETIAVISDAGMPGVSDPGEVLIGKLIEKEISYEVLPGPSAHVVATVAANIPEGRYTFWGFLPQKAGEREKILKQWENSPLPMAFYEAPHRMEKTIASIEKILGKRNLVLARELTKLYEEIVFTNTEDFLKSPEDFTLKGEFVLLLMPKEAGEETVDIQKELQKKLDEGMKMSQAVKAVAKEQNLPKNAVYKESLEME